MSKRVVAVHISGQEYRIRSDADETALQRVAGMVDAAMSQIASRTGTVDTLDVAILTSLNLARELLALRERADGDGDGHAAEQDEGRLRGLIELAESALLADPATGERTPLLTLPAGHELEDGQGDLLGGLIDGAVVESGPAPR